MVTEGLTHAGDGHRYYRFPVELTANRRKRARAEQSKVSSGAQRLAEHAGWGMNTPWGAHSPFFADGERARVCAARGQGQAELAEGEREGGGGFVAPQPQHIGRSFLPLQTATKRVQRKKRSQPEVADSARSATIPCPCSVPLGVTGDEPGPACSSGVHRTGGGRKKQIDAWHSARFNKQLFVRAGFSFKSQRSSLRDTEP